MITVNHNSFLYTGWFIATHFGLTRSHRYANKTQDNDYVGQVTLFHISHQRYIRNSVKHNHIFSFNQQVCISSDICFDQSSGWPQQRIKVHSNVED